MAQPKKLPNPAYVTTTVPAIGDPWPGLEDSLYAGNTRGEPDYHLVLVAQHGERSLKWKDAGAWAKRVGAELPSRSEIALLFANLHDEFEGRFYWCSTPCSMHDAWSMNFADGTQIALRRRIEASPRRSRRWALACGVRRFSLSDLTPAQGITDLLLHILHELKAGRSDIEKIFHADIGGAA